MNRLLLAITLAALTFSQLASAAQATAAYGDSKGIKVVSSSFAEAGDVDDKTRDFFQISLYNYLSKTVSGFSEKFSSIKIRSFSSADTVEALWRTPCIAILSPTQYIHATSEVPSLGEPIGVLCKDGSDSDFYSCVIVSKRVDPQSRPKETSDGIDSVTSSKISHLYYVKKFNVWIVRTTKDTI
ncbi:MAG: hypothetical protein K2Y21_04640 [Phycisphaerales bacterium]|nr:hypothetical protein [Phycisphaerales bacterium]